MFKGRKQTREGLRSEFEKTALPFMQALYNKAYRLVQNSEDASDLVQETYLRAYRTFSNFKEGTNCKAWLFKILYSVFVNQYRKKQREPEMVSLDEIEEKFSQTLADPQFEAQTAYMQNPNFDWQEPEIEKALGQLPETFRAVIWLIDIENFSYEEAASIMKCPVGTVRSRLFRARKILWVELWDYACKQGIIKRTPANEKVNRDRAFAKSLK